MNEFTIKIDHSEINDRFDHLESQIRSIQEALNIKQSKELISQEMLINELGISKVTLYRQIKSGNIPVVKIGKKNMFNREKVFEALQNQNKKFIRNFRKN